MLLASTVLVSLLALPVLAADMSEWSDKSVCRLVTSTQDNAVYVAEALGRKLNCGSEAKSSSNKQQSEKKSLPKNKGIVFYPTYFDAQVSKKLLAKPISNIEFDFSSYQLATLSQPISCRFNLQRVVYENHAQGLLEHWNMAQGTMLFTNEGVTIEGYWRMGGLSKDSNYLKNEVNLKLTKAGHVVGKMAYFHLNVRDGQVIRKPLYVELKPHKRSKPLTIANSNTAQLWADVEDWAGGVWQLTQCKESTF